MWLKVVPSEKYRHGILLLLVALLAYWPISTLFYTFKWDVLDVVLPLRYHVGECIRHGIFPFWNPYQLTGFPIHADLQAPTWYPELWLVGALGGYSLAVFHLVFLSTIFAAGLGFYKLCTHFTTQNYYALMAATIYMLSGFVVGHGQHFFAIVGAAWLPWVLYCYLHFLKAPHFEHLAKLTLACFLLLSGGYQAISIITAYLLFGLFVQKMIQERRNGEKLKQLAGYHFLWAMLLLALLSPILVSTFQISEFTTRFSQGALADEIMKGPFSPQSLISLLLPFGAALGDDIFATDISLRNAYLALLPLLVLPFVRKSGRIPSSLRFLLGFGFVALLAAMGSYLPVRKLLADVFPLMNQFRMPGYFILFAIIPALLLFVHVLPAALQAIRQNPKNLRIAILSTFILIAVINVVAGFMFEFPSFHWVGDTFDARMHALSFTDRLALSSVAQILLLLLIFWWLAKKSHAAFFHRGLWLLVAADMFLSVQGYAYFSTYSPISPHAIQADLDRFPSGFPVPPTEPIADANRGALHERPLWRNLGVYHKRVSFDGFTSLVFDRYAWLTDSATAFKDALLQRPLFYLNNQVAPYSSFLIDGDHAQLSYLPDEYFPGEIGNDSTTSENHQLAIHSFSPVKMVVECAADGRQWLHIMQARYSGWTAKVNGEERALVPANFLYMALPLAPGRNVVELEYRNPAVIRAVALMVLCLAFVLLALALWHWKKQKTLYRPALLSFLLLLVVVGTFAVRNGQSRHAETEYWLEEVMHNAGEKSLVMACGVDGLFEQHRAKLFRPNFTFKGDLRQFREAIGDNSLQEIYLVNDQAYIPTEALRLIQQLFPCSEPATQTGDSRYIMRYYKGDCPARSIIPLALYDFEQEETVRIHDSIFSREGRAFLRLSTERPYGPVFRIKVKDLGVRRPGDYLLVTKLQMRCEAGAAPQLVFSSHEHMKRSLSKSYPLLKQYREAGGWQQLSADFTLHHGLDPEDEIELFLWNPGAGQAWIDHWEIGLERK